LPANWEKTSVILSFTIFFIIFVASFKVFKVLNVLKVFKDPKVIKLKKHHRHARKAHPPFGQLPQAALLPEEGRQKKINSICSEKNG
jgi:hypothetical protein